MLRAAVEDFSALPGVGVRSLLADDFPATLPGECHRCGHTDEREVFARLAQRAAWTLVIAPESDGLLAERCRWVEQAGGCLLNPSSAVVEQVSDKLGLRRPPFPQTWHVDSPEIVYPAVLKPRRGAGSQDTFRLDGPDDLARYLASVSQEMVAQRYVPGQPASVLAVVGPRQTLLFPPATQRLSADGRFGYLGGTVPLAPDLVAIAHGLAAQTLTAVGLARVPVPSSCPLPPCGGGLKQGVSKATPPPGPLSASGRGGKDQGLIGDGLLHCLLSSLPLSASGRGPGGGVLQTDVGVFGIDLVLDPEANASGGWAIEVNARLTTSYVGLRALARDNLAAAILAVRAGHDLPELTWHPGPVAFAADGTVSGPRGCSP